MSLVTHIRKTRTPSVLNCVSLDFSGRNLKSSRNTRWSPGSQIVQSFRFYGRKNFVPSENGSNSGGGLSKHKEKASRRCASLQEDQTASDGGLSKRREKASRCAAQQEAQTALIDYLHFTRNFQLTDAEYWSRNSPYFLERLLGNVKNGTEIRGSVARFLRYNAVNEFELFFESIGLEPSEHHLLLPRKLIFLNDDGMLLENYHVLCNYGIPRKSIGGIFKEATEVFKYDYGVLQSKLQAFQEMRLNQSTIIKFISSCPNLLTAKNRDIHSVLEKFKSIGIESSWIEGHMLEGNTYNCIHMLDLLSLLCDMGCREEQLGKLILQHPEFLFEASGKMAFSIVGFLLKFGFTKNEICSMVLQFPQVQVGKFLFNLRQCYHFLVEIEMESQEIGKIVRSHLMMLGSCSLKKLNSLLASAKSGKKRLCDLVKENPQILKDWVLGSKVKPIPKSEEQVGSQMMKTNFLLGLGFVENSNEMRKALKVFRGKGGELQERFDCFVKAGLKTKDVSNMIKVAPTVLNQTKDVIEMKINFLVNGLGYPISSLVAFPQYVSYTIQRVKLRFWMYDWLKGQGRVKPNLAMCTVLSCSDKVFIRRFVNDHPGGPKAWQKLKKKICLD